MRKLIFFMLITLTAVYVISAGSVTIEYIGAEDYPVPVLILSDGGQGYFVLRKVLNSEGHKGVNFYVEIPHTIYTDFMRDTFSKFIPGSESRAAFICIIYDPEFGEYDIDVHSMIFAIQSITSKVDDETVKGLLTDYLSLILRYNTVPLHSP